MIRVKVLDILDNQERNIKWLSDKTGVNYSTLYNFSHNKTTSVNFDILEKLCNFFDCDITGILEIDKKNKSL